MTEQDRRVVALRELHEEIFRQFHAADAAAADGLFHRLNLQERRVLEILGAGESRMMRELADALGVAVNTVTSIVDGMERNEHLRRRRSDEDRRVVYVELTDAGREMHRQFTEAKNRFMRRILDPLTEDEQEILLVLFRKVARIGRTERPDAASPNDLG